MQLISTGHAVPFSYEFHSKLLKTVCHNLYDQGWRQIFMICHTNPEDLAAAMAARDLFDIEGELPRHLVGLQPASGKARDS